jgi:uncharacterized protein
MGRPVVHFEIAGQNGAELQRFYAEAFGWEIHADNPMNYGFVHTKAGKGIDGGIAEREPRVNVVIEVDDLQATLDRIEQLGGKTVVPPTEIPGAVTFAEFQDPQGNVVGIALP